MLVSSTKQSQQSQAMQTKLKELMMRKKNSNYATTNIKTNKQPVL